MSLCAWAQLVEWMCLYQQTQLKRVRVAVPIRRAASQSLASIAAKAFSFDRLFCFARAYAKHPRTHDIHQCGRENRWRCRANGGGANESRLEQTKRIIRNQATEGTAEKWSPAPRWQLLGERSSSSANAIIYSQSSICVANHRPLNLQAAGVRGDKALRGGTGSR